MRAIKEGMLKTRLILFRAISGGRKGGVNANLYKRSGADGIGQDLFAAGTDFFAVDIAGG
jgi:hypothetical protein